MTALQGFHSKQQDAFILIAQQMVLKLLVLASDTLCHETFHGLLCLVMLDHV